MVAWSIKRCLGGYWNTKSNYLFYIMHAFSLYTESECMRLFEFVSFILQFRSLKERFNTNTSRSKSYHEVYPYISPKLITSTKKWSFSSHQFFYTSYYRHDSNAVRPSLGDCPFPICMAYLGGQACLPNFCLYAGGGLFSHPQSEKVSGTIALLGDYI